MGHGAGHSIQKLSTDSPAGGYAVTAKSVSLVRAHSSALPVDGAPRRAQQACMSTTTTPSHRPSVQWLIESRPPGITWSRPAPAEPNQPPLDLADHEDDHPEIAAVNDRGIRVSTVKAGWAAQPRPGLPNAQQWSTTLALAIIQAMLGQRPVAQLNRWIVDEVLAGISMYQRRSIRVHGRVAVPVSLCSVRVQHPGPEVAEVAAHAMIGKRSAAMAFRLEALGDRWLCTALELGAQ